jgi:hypothetical protein
MGHLYLSRSMFVTEHIGLILRAVISTQPLSKAILLSKPKASCCSSARLHPLMHLGAEKSTRQWTYAALGISSPLGAGDENKCDLQKRHGGREPHRRPRPTVGCCAF